MSYKSKGIAALSKGKIDLAQTLLTLSYNEKPEDIVLCFILICNVAKHNMNFAKIIIKDLVANQHNQPQEYLDYLLEFLLKYTDNKQEQQELECISYDDFVYILSNTTKNKKEKIISIINSSRIVISSKKELRCFLDELVKAQLYDIALIYCEQTYMHFMGDEYFVNIVLDLMKRLKNASKI